MDLGREAIGGDRVVGLESGQKDILRGHGAHVGKSSASWRGAGRMRQWRRTEAPPLSRGALGGGGATAQSTVEWTYLTRTTHAHTHARTYALR